MPRRWILAVVVVQCLQASSMLAGEGDRARQFLRGAARSFFNSGRSEPAPREVGVQNRRYVTRTADGWKIVAIRYWSATNLNRQHSPVILCHGFNYNGRFFDLTESTSLARYLAHAGFDVWVPDLRGSGLSSKWALSAQGGADALIGRFTSRLMNEEIPANGYASLDPKYGRWKFDDHVDYDVPAILNLVRQHTGAPKISWLGHSMGGNIMLAYLSKYGPDQSVGRLVTVGSQVTMPDGQLFLQFFVEMVRIRELQLSGENADLQRVLIGMNRIFFNESNTDPQIVRALATTGHDLPSTGLTRQYADLATSGLLRDANKQRVYADGLNQIQCPCLFVAGAADQVAPPVVQRFLQERVSSTDKRVLVLGRKEGFRADYGHNDSLIGRQSSSDVFPHLARFLAGAQ